MDEGGVGECGKEAGGCAGALSMSGDGEGLEGEGFLDEEVVQWHCNVLKGKLLFTRVLGRKACVGRGPFILVSRDSRGEYRPGIEYSRRNRTSQLAIVCG